MLKQMLEKAIWLFKCNSLSIGNDASNVKCIEREKFYTIEEHCTSENKW